MNSPSWLTTLAAGRPYFIFGSLTKAISLSETELTIGRILRAAVGRLDIEYAETIAFLAPCFSVFAACLRR